MYFPIDIQTWSVGWEPYKDETAYAKLRERIPSLPEKTLDYRTMFWGSQADAVVLKELGIDWQLDKEALLSTTGSMISKLQGQLGVPVQDAIVEGTAVQISIPDLGLMVINQVELLSNCCTDMLQDYLDNGWRILAVCPPNSQGRPDYIVGRQGARD